MSSAYTPWQCGRVASRASRLPRWRVVITSTAIQRSRRLMLGCARACASSASWIALPVASAAWAMRRTAWPPSRVRCRPSGPAGSAENGTPCVHQPLARPRALRSAMKRAVCSSTRPAPASCVSRTCESTLSSSSRARRRCRPAPRPWRPRRAGAWPAPPPRGPVPPAVPRSSPARPAPTTTTGGTVVRKCLRPWRGSVGAEARILRSGAERHGCANRCTSRIVPVWPISQPPRSGHRTLPQSLPATLFPRPSQPRTHRTRNVRHAARPPLQRSRPRSRHAPHRRRHRTAVAGHADRRRQGRLSRPRRCGHRPTCVRRPVGTVRRVPAGRGHAAALRTACAGLPDAARHRHRFVGAGCWPPWPPPSPRKVQKLVIRQQGYGVALAHAAVRRAALAPGRNLRVYSTQIDGDTRRATSWPSAAGAQPPGRACCWANCRRMRWARTCSRCATPSPRALAEPPDAAGAAGTPATSSGAGAPLMAGTAACMVSTTPQVSRAGGCLVVHQRRLEPARTRAATSPRMRCRCRPRRQRQPTRPCATQRLPRPSWTADARQPHGRQPRRDPAAGAEPDAEHGAPHPAAAAGTPQRSVALRSDYARRAGRDQGRHAVLRVRSSTCNAAGAFRPQRMAERLAAQGRDAGCGDWPTRPGARPGPSPTPTA